MLSLKDYTCEYFDNQLNEGLLDIIKRLFSRNKDLITKSKKRGLLPATADIDEIKFIKKPIKGLSEFKKALKSGSTEFSIASKMLNEIGKRTLEGSGEKVDPTKCEFIQFIYKPKYSFKNEQYICAVAGYVNGQNVFDKKHGHILFFDGDESIIKNWKNLRDDIFTTFVNKFVKNKQLSMWYVNNITELPQYDGKKFEDVESSKNNIAKID